METDYKNLAAAVVRSAVEDMQSAYKKVLKWDKLDKSGRLKEYIEEKIRTNKPDEISLTNDGLTAIAFLQEGSDGGELYFSMLDIEGLPASIVAQRNFVKANGTRLEVRIRRLLRLPDFWG